MSRLEARNIEIAYETHGKHRLILSDFNLKAGAGEVISLIGSNGTGKSSLLRVLSGMQEPARGEISWNDQNLNEIPLRNRPRHLASLFSNYARVDGFTVYDLVALGRQPYLGVFGKLSSEDHSVVLSSLEKTGMLAFAKYQLGTLSDGEFRKAMLAKMLAQNAPVMILDEPTTHLDLPSSIEFLKLIRKLAKDEQKTILLSSHNLSLVFKMADKMILLSNNGEYAIGMPDEITNHELMCGFLKTSDVFFEDGNLVFNPKNT